MRERYIVIPALEPGWDFPDYAARVRRETGGHIVVVDDGSGPRYTPVFQAVRRIEGCVVLTHEGNRGKGRALKTGFAYVRALEEGPKDILCVDCDGQHRVEDIRRICDRLEDFPEALILGGRTFGGRAVPWRSRLGNWISSLIFWVLCGKWLPDTQTGLRGFESRLLDTMLQVPGERFEYETQMLLACVRGKIPICTQEIQTIYEDGNAGSHFRPFQDSVSVMKAMFSGIFRFGLASLLCAVLDLTLFWSLCRTLGAEGTGQFSGITAAAVLARIVSATANYWINHTYVFGRGNRNAAWEGRSLWRYYGLCVILAAVSGIIVSVLERLLGVRPVTGKIFTDTLLFFASYRLQETWVFSERKVEEDEG